jgi:hypothetical protein
MISDYLRGRAFIESVRGSVDFEHLCWFWVFLTLLSFYIDFEFFLLFWAFLSSSLPFCLVSPRFLSFVGFCGFPPARWSSWAFLSFFYLLAVLHEILDSNFKLCAFVVIGLMKGEIEKPIGQFLGLIVRSHWLARFEFESEIVLFYFYLLLFCSKNRVCLSHGVQVAGAAWRASTRTVAGVGDLVQRTGDGRLCWILGGRVVKRSGGAVCGLHLARGD